MVFHAIRLLIVYKQLLSSNLVKIKLHDSCNVLNFLLSLRMNLTFDSSYIIRRIMTKSLWFKFSCNGIEF